MKQLTKQSWFTMLKSRLARTGDSEPEQALIRVGLSFIMMNLFFVLSWLDGNSFLHGLQSITELATVIFFISSVIIFLLIVRNPIASPVRRLIGAVADVAILSIEMYLGSGVAAGLFVFYLWVILGNGFRFGVSYLRFSHLITILGFSAAAVYGEFWQSNQAYASGVWVVLLLIPIYASFLISKLHGAMEDAKYANKAKTQFLANMSHELRTPLNAVIGMGKLLQQTDLNTEQKQIAATMDTSAKTLLGLIEKVLDISKIEAGKLTINEEPFDLHALTNSVVTMLTPLSKDKGLRLSSHIKSDTPFALAGDAPHIRQVLINLVGNAIKFTEQGNVSINVSQAAQDESPTRIRFEISDTGMGIADEVQKTIFDGFTQIGQHYEDEKLVGTGLGTTIAKELVERMGGEIGVESILGQGAIFWFELPLTLQPQKATVSLSENHVLLLSPDSTSAVVTPMLQRWDVAFEWEASSARALSTLLAAAEPNQDQKTNPYTSIIVDIASLNKVEPVQFAEMVREEKAFENITLILINSLNKPLNHYQVNQHYMMVLDAPIEKRLLFNAIHASQTMQNTADNVQVLTPELSENTDRLSILVAEDNRVNQRVIEGLLTHAGHDVALVDTGEKALDALSQENIDVDVLILDMNMPEVSGVDVVKTLRFMQPYRDLPIIMLTADATPEAQSACLEAGANVFLTKPLDVDLLLDHVASLSTQSQRAERKRNQQKRATVKGGNAAIPDLFDQSVLNNLVALGEGIEFVQELIENFVADGRRHITIILSAATEDYLQYRESLHALKGSASEFGATPLVDLCAQAEKLKPYDVGSVRIKNLSREVEVIFSLTEASLTQSVQAIQDNSLFD